MFHAFCCYAFCFCFLIDLCFVWFRLIFRVHVSVPCFLFTFPALCCRFVVARCPVFCPPFPIHCHSLPSYSRCVLIVYPDNLTLLSLVFSTSLRQLRKLWLFHFNICFYPLTSENMHTSVDLGKVSPSFPRSYRICAMVKTDMSILFQFFCSPCSYHPVSHGDEPCKNYPPPTIIGNV